MPGPPRTSTPGTAPRSGWPGTRAKQRRGRNLNHRCTQMHRAASGSVLESPYLQPRLGKIEQQANPRASRLEVVDTLRRMLLAQRPSQLQSRHDLALLQQLDGTFPNRDSIVTNNDPVLPHHRQPALAQFVRQRVFVHFLQKPGPERIGHPKRPADHPLRHHVGLGFICVNLSASVVEFPCRPANIPGPTSRSRIKPAFP